MRVTVVASLMVLFVYMGCGGSGGTKDGGMTTGAAGINGGGDAAVDPELAAFCALVKATRTNVLARCTGQATAIAAKFVDFDPCAAFGPSVAGGRMAFDPNNVAACIAALEAAPCDTDRLPNACDSVLRGLVPPGSACNLISEIVRFSECEVGTFCVAPITGGCQGTCVAGALLTRPCSGSQPCLAGETCSLADGTCTLKGSSGDECGFTTILVCEQGLVCSDLFGGTCGARKPSGALCTGQPTECEFPLQCDRGLDIEGTCRMPPRPGDACVVNEFQCSIGLSTCGPDGTCHAGSGIGEPCGGTDGEGQFCIIGECDTAAATPVCKRLAVGDYCGATADCPVGSLCIPQLGYGVCTANCL
jgi:hypothetical protein